MADAFFVAFRLPNHFRAIFAEGAFTAAFVPAYARTLRAGRAPRGQAVRRPHRRGAARHQSRAAGAGARFHPSVVSLLAPGLADDPDALRSRRDAHPHHLSLSRAGLDGDDDLRRAQRQWQRFAAAAGAPILLNICMVVDAAVAHCFPTRAMPPPGACSRRRGASRCWWRPTPSDGIGIRLRMPRLDPTDAEIPKGAGAGHHRRRRRAACAVRRYADRLLPADRRAVGALLRRPHQPASDRRGRHRRGHRAVAGNVAAARRRR